MPNFTQEATTTEVAEAFASHIVGKVILITGGSPNGLGATATVAIAKHDPALIILTGRNRALIEETQAAILAEVPNVKIRLLIFDLADLKSVREAAEEVNGYAEKIDVLINNAGIMAAPYQKTVDGIESHFGVNHIGHFLFTVLTVDKFNQGARIINISSGGYAFGGIRFEDPSFESAPYDKWQAYAQSKTANILFSASLAEKLGLRSILSFSVSTGGGVFTNLGKHLTAEDYEMLSSVTILTAEQGASSYIAAAFDPKLRASNGAYIEFCKPVPEDEIKPWAKGKENTDKLWSLSEKLVGEKFSL